MAAALAPVVSLRFKPQSAVRLLSAYTKTNPRNFPTTSQTRTATLHFPQLYQPLTPPFIFFGVGAARPRRRCLCTAISGALSSGEAIEKPKPEFFSAETGEKVGEFRKRLRVVDIKGGPDEGLDRLGQTLAVKGWVRTLRVQSSVIFLEVSLIDFYRDWLLGNGRNENKIKRKELVFQRYIEQLNKVTIYGLRFKQSNVFQMELFLCNPMDNY